MESFDAELSPGRDMHPSLEADQGSAFGATGGGLYTGKSLKRKNVVSKNLHMAHLHQVNKAA